MDRYFIGDYFVSDASKPIQDKLKMPIEWTVMERTNDGKALLLSRNVIDWEIYGCEDEVTWDNSYMKEYLEKLYNLVFSAEEQEAILPHEFGSLFLLSKEEIQKYLADEEARRAVQYFVEKNDDEFAISLEHNTYWLRTNGCSRDEVPIVDALGEFDSERGDADEVGIRPAMWVDEKKARVLTAKKGYNNWHHYWKPDEF